MMNITCECRNTPIFWMVINAPSRNFIWSKKSKISPIIFGYRKVV